MRAFFAFTLVFCVVVRTIHAFSPTGLPCCGLGVGLCLSLRGSRPNTRLSALQSLPPSSASPLASLFDVPWLSASSAGDTYSLNPPLKASFLDISSNIVHEQSSIVLASAAAEWVQPTYVVTDWTLNILSFLMLVRIVLSWYPKALSEDNPIPGVKLIVGLTEGLLKATR